MYAWWTSSLVLAKAAVGKHTRANHGSAPPPRLRYHICYLGCCRTLKNMHKLRDTSTALLLVVTTVINPVTPACINWFPKHTFNSSHSRPDSTTTRPLAGRGTPTYSADPNSH